LRRNLPAAALSGELSGLAGFANDRHNIR
jgi:hypothetical protein